MIIVTLPYDPTWQALEWAKKHCPSYITNAVTPSPFDIFRYPTIDYFFANEKDKLTFLLRWS